MVVQWLPRLVGSHISLQVQFDLNLAVKFSSTKVIAYKSPCNLVALLGRVAHDMKSRNHNQ